MSNILRDLLTPSPPHNQMDGHAAPSAEAAAAEAAADAAAEARLCESLGWRLLR